MSVNAQPAPQFTPSSIKVQMPTNYVSLYDWSTHHKPEVADALSNIYGKQSVAGMLSMLQEEGTYASDRYIWTEEGRLHTRYTDVTRSGSVFTKNNHVFRVNETVQLSAGSLKVRGIITAADTNTFTVSPYKSAGFTGFATSAITAYVDGSEFRKGTSGQSQALETDYTVLSNKGIILKDFYEVSGSEAASIGWIKTQEGGHLWYLQSEADTRRRWEDRLELAMVNGEAAEAGSDAQVAGYEGTEGLFEAIRVRGNTFAGLADTLPDFDDILKRFDAQGKIQDYMHYVDRDQSLAVDDLLGSLNAGYDGGISYGIFDNDKDMAVNLGFKGFTRGSYNFFKSDWKLLNDNTLLGAVPAAAKVRGIMIPVSSTEVYEGEYNGSGSAEKTKVPYLQCKYRVAGIENRKYKTWVLGTVGNVKTNSNDKMEVHHLSERMLATVGANNFMLFEGN